MTLFCPCRQEPNILSY